MSSCKGGKQNPKQQTKAKQTEDIPKPVVDGSAAEFFGRKPTIEEIQKLLSPSGFLTESAAQDYDGVSPLGTFEQLQPNRVLKKDANITSTSETVVATEPEAAASATTTAVKADYMKDNLNEWGMPKELGFKVKGPEPTRFGDWERKGRATDF